jgi:hypothetical protein
MEEALRCCLAKGYTTVSLFKYASQLKRDSAQAFLDSLTKGDNPRLRRGKLGKAYIYFPIKKDSPDKE